MVTASLTSESFFNDIGVFREMAGRGCVWLIGDDQTRLNPIHGADLAEVVRGAFASDDTSDRSVGGPDVMTQSAIAACAFEASGRPAKVTRVPSGIVRTIGRLIEPVNANAGANLQMFALMGRRDMIGDAVGTHHLADELQRPGGRRDAGSTTIKTDEAAIGRSTGSLAS